MFGFSKKGPQIQRKVSSHISFITLTEDTMWKRGKLMPIDHADRSQN